MQPGPCEQLVILRQFGEADPKEVRDQWLCVILVLHDLGEVIRSRSNIRQVSARAITEVLLRVRRYVHLRRSSDVVRTTS